MTAYSFLNYRDFLKAFLDAKKSASTKHSYAWLADKIGVQRSYLSRVLAGKASFSPDQLYLACKSLHLNARERDYVLLLLEIDRSGVHERRTELESQRDRIRAKNDRSAPYLQREAHSPTGEDFMQYYTQPLCPIVHMHLVVPRYLEQPSLLTEKLSISESALDQVLATLRKCGIITLEENRYKLLNPTMHISGTPLSRLYATQFRHKAIEYQQRIGNDKDYFFTSSFSATDSTRDEIKQKFFDFLRWTGKQVEKAESQEVFHMNFDLFKI